MLRIDAVINLLKHPVAIYTNYPVSRNNLSITGLKGEGDAGNKIKPLNVIVFYIL